MSSATWTPTHQDQSSYSRCWVPSQPTTETNTESLIRQHSPGASANYLVAEIMLDCFHCERDNTLFLLEQTLTLDLVLPSLPTVLLPQLPSVDLQNALVSIMAFQEALLLTKELISQHLKCGIGPMLMESNSLTTFSGTLKQLA